ncbi:MAG: acylphosphatase, partial [Thermoplasmata archaeon]
MSRFRILLQGDVQQVGFREFVKKVSQKFQAKGCVRNLDDGSVEIYCELANGKLEAYIQNLKAGPGIVEQILIFDESTAEFGIPPTDFTKFKVLRDEDEIAETLSVMTSVG